MDKILTEAFDKLKAIEEGGDEASRNRKMQRAFADLKDEMTDQLQGLTDKLLRKFRLNDDDYIWGSAARPYKRGQGFMLSTRVSGKVQDIEKFVAQLNKEMAGSVDAIEVGSMHDTNNPPIAWIRAKFPNKYAKLSQIEEGDYPPEQREFGAAGRDSETFHDAAIAMLDDQLDMLEGDDRYGEKADVIRYALKRLQEVGLGR